MNDEPHFPTVLPKLSTAAVPADAICVRISGSDWQDYTEGGLAALVPAAKAAYR